MKLFKKRSNILIAFVVGALLFTGAAFAEIKTLTGYEELKNAVKQSIHAYEKFDSYTTVSVMTLKDNGTILMKNEDISKQDNVNRSSESSSENISFGKVNQIYHYDDKNQSISYNDSDDTYYVFKKYDIDYKDYISPEVNLDDPTFKAFEKVIDAGVAAFNLQNAIVAERDKDGNITLSGALGEGQIHPFINAVFSFAFTQTTAYARNVGGVAADVAYPLDGPVAEKIVNETTREEENKFPVLEGDVFIKSVSGEMKLDKDKIIQSVHIKAVVSGREKDGTIHDFEFEVNAEVSDINKTVVTEPDLTGKKVVYQDNIYNEYTISEAFLGTYKTDIIELRDDKFVKVGENYLEITRIEAGKVTFKTYDVIDGKKQNEAEISANIEGYNWATYEFLNDETGNMLYGSLNFNENGTINRYGDNKSDMLYTRIFE